MSMIDGQIRKFRDDEYVPLGHIPPTATVRIDFYGDDEPEYFTPAEATSYWKACAWLGLSKATMWNSRDPGLIHMTDQCMSLLRKQEIGKHDLFAIRDLLTTKAAVRADSLFEGHDWLKIKREEGIQEELNPGLVFQEMVSVTPDVRTEKFARGCVIWEVQSIDMDDLVDRLPNLDDALIRAATRALKRQLLDQKYALELVVN